MPDNQQAATARPRTSIFDFTKPHKSEATLRIRNSAVGISVLLLLTHLSPLPSLWTCIRVVSSEHLPAVSWKYYLCSVGECVPCQHIV